MALDPRLSRRLQSRPGRGANRPDTESGEIRLGAVQAAKQLVIAGMVGSALAFLVFWVAFLGVLAWAVGALA